MAAPALAAPGGTACSPAAATPGAPTRMSSGRRIDAAVDCLQAVATRWVGVAALQLSRPPAPSPVRHPTAPLRSTPPPAVEVDQVAQFFSFSDNGRALSPPPRTDCMQMELENAMQEALVTPLAFEDGGRSPSPPIVKPAELESPEMLPCLLPCITSPAAATVGF